ncbi:MAG TPA: hypothetical protein VFH44_01900 [Solirubrobacterales bacterium]|nr:hypothetical protein [Solirubrobacterales bacterium]
MEASQTPPPGGSANSPPAGGPAPGGEGRDERAGVGARVAAVVLALALAIICFAGVTVMTDVADKGLCEELELTRIAGIHECYDFPESAEPVVLGAGWAGSILAAVAAIIALAFAVLGRGGRLLLAVTAAAVVLLAVSIVAARL